MNCTAPKLLASDVNFIGALAADANGAYFLRDEGLFFCNVAGCSAPVRVGPGGWGSVAVRRGVKYWVSGNAIVACAAESCDSPRTVAASTNPEGIAVDENHVYWRDTSEYRVRRASLLGGGTDVEVLAEGFVFGHGRGHIALDGEYAYWTVASRLLRRRK